jgi:hypothetical protein
MKKIMLIPGLLLSLSAVAEIAPPPANYTIAADDTVIDATGQVNDDPEQVVDLTSTEVPTVKSEVKQVETEVQQDWQTRHDDAMLTAH